MEKEKYIEIPAKTKKMKEVFCDLCGRDVTYDYGGDEVEEDDSCYWQDNVKLFYEGGTVYPEGGTKEGKRIDLCYKCMKEKVMPLVEKEFNIKARETEWDNL